MKKGTIAFMIAVLLIVTTIVAVAVSGTYTYNSRPVVCIDAGHGGDDLGASYNSRNEKDDNLLLAKAVKADLDEQNFKVVMTRSSDEFVSLEERCNIANEKNAVYFVALHRNSAKSGNGVEIWIKNDNPTQDASLAGNILTELDNVGVSADRGVRTGIESNPQGNYYVNRNTVMPSCLVETGFITDETDNKLFDEHFEAYAAAIADGIAKTYSEYNLTVTTEH